MHVRVKSSNRLVVAHNLRSYNSQAKFSRIHLKLKLLTFFHLQTYKLIHLGIYPDLFINQRSYTNIWLFAKHNHNSGLNTGIVLILLHLKTRYTLNVWKTLQVTLANPSNWYNKHKKADLENYIYLNGNTSVPLSRI